MTLRFRFNASTLLLATTLALVSSAARAQPPAADASENRLAPAGQAETNFSDLVDDLVPAEPNAEFPSATDNDSVADQLPTEPPPGYQQELDRRIAVFEAVHKKLAVAVADQRAIMIRYLNREDRTPAARKAYHKQREKVRRLMDEAYDAGLDILRVGPHPESAQFVMTWIQNRLKHDIYSASTMEGAIRLINGGANFIFLFQAGARSAVVVGDFELAKRLFDAIPEDQMEEIDRTLEYNLEKYREAFTREQALREKEAAENHLPRVKLTTSQGEVVIELFLDQAPSTVSNFIKLVEQGHYDGNDFMQVVDHLLALTGDPSGTGTGNTGEFLKDEHERPDARDAWRGSLVMAKMPVDEEGNFIPDSASSQFAILYLPVISASEKQTVFGRVIEGMDTIGRLRRVDPSKKKDKDKVQLPPDYIVEAEVIRRPENLPEPEYVDLKAKVQELKKQQAMQKQQALQN